MKILKREKYTTPVLGSAALEAEGLFCQSLINTQVDEIQDVNVTGGEPFYFEK